MDRLPVQELEALLFQLEHYQKTKTECKYDYTAYKDDPVGFCKNVLGVSLWSKQREILRALATQPRVSVRSCHGAGKTFVAACATLWFVQTRPGSVAITTAPTGRQVKDLLWRRINAAFHQALLPMNGRCLTTTMDCGYEWYASGYATDEQVSFQGPHCLSSDHTILTRRGWLGLDEVNEQDEVLSVPLNGRAAKWMPVTAVHCYDFKGKLNVYDSRTMSFAVTDEHRFPAKRDGRAAAWDMLPFSTIGLHALVRGLSGWEGTAFSVPAPFAAYGWSPEQFAEFLGFWIGDGGLRESGKSGRFYEVILYQVKPDQGYSRGLLPGVVVFEGRDHVAFSNRDCAQWLLDNVGRYQTERQVPRFILDAPPAVLDAFAEGFWRAEGSFVQGERRQVYNTNRRLMDQVQELLIKLGRPSTLGVNRPASPGLPIKGQATGPWKECLVMSWVHDPHDRTLARQKVKRVPYEGRVWCISTPYETFYTRRNGKVFLSGNSPKGVLFVGDEASGLAEWVFPAVQGFMTQDDAKMLLIGNPNYAHGYFYESQRRWPKSQRFKISAFEAPAWILRPDWKQEMLLDYGVDSPTYAIRVLGDFPSQSESALFNLAELEKAMERRFEHEPEDGFAMGVDIARYGPDESVAYVRNGHQVVHAEYWRGHDTMQSVGRVTRLCRQFWPHTINVDEVGLGAGVVDRLSEDGWPVTGVNVGVAAKNSQEYDNLRMELYMELAQRCKAGTIALPEDDQRLVDQLTSLTYSFTSRGKRKLISKEELRKEGLKSPDRADALMLAFATGIGGWTAGATVGPARSGWA